MARRSPFRTLRSKLTILYAGMFALALLAIAGVAHILIEAGARRSTAAGLVSAGTVYDRLWAEREQQLAGAAEILTRDFGFRAAVASGDAPTIVSALSSLRARARVTSAMVVDLDGRVAGEAGPLARSVATLPFRLPAGQRDAVVVTGGHVYRVVLSPVLAPNPIGWAVFAVRLDATEMRALERLSAIPLIATVLRRDGRHWVGATDRMASDPDLDRLIEGVAGSGASPVLDLPHHHSYALVRPLAGAGQGTSAVLLLRYPLGLALAPFRPLQFGIGLAGAIGMLLVLLGSGRLARSITRPLAALDQAAQALEEGARTEVAVEGADEIARLAESFNRMSAGILEREHRIAHLAFHDSLTGLPNRVAFRQALDQAIARGLRSGEQAVVLCLDLDGFKGVNDTLGHPVGDALLRLVGDVLMRLVPDGLVSRLGGDEFAVVLAGTVAPDRPRALAQAIVDALREPVEALGHTVATGASIGIAVGPDDGADADRLLKNADLALYRAKQDGRGTFRFFEPALDAAAQARRELELDLRAAVAAGQFELHYQPVMDLRAGRIGSVEALLRWHHPTRGPVSPAEFIPVAEEMGLIVPMGEWVLHEACRAAAAWPPHVRIAVNVSALQFRNPGFQAVVAQALARSGLAPSRLEVEVTESVFLEGEGPVTALLHRLRAMGLRIALDDFGTGYSSLSYLRSFPFNRLKIDRSFVIPIAHDPGAAAIVRAIVELARALGMDITAEGVEEPAQLERLRDQGCDHIQGYLFSRPVPGHAVPALLDTLVAKAA